VTSESHIPQKGAGKNKKITAISKKIEKDNYT
jgi:hypothetical protein